jgi:AsmA protein
MVGVGGFIGLAILVAAAVILYLGVNSRARVEAVASEALGMEFNVVGRSTIGILPNLHFTLRDVHVRTGGAEVASAGEVDLGIGVLPLLHHEASVERIGLKNLRIVIEREGDGKWNIQRPPRAQQTVSAFSIANISALNTTILVADKPTGKRLEVSDCNLTVDRLSLPGGDPSDFLKNLSFAAKLNCGKVRTNDLTGSDLTLASSARNGTIDFNPIAMRLLGGLGSGSARAEYSGSVPVYQLHGRLMQFRMEEFFEAMSPRKVGAGLLDFSANLTLRGSIASTVVRKIDGQASLRGTNLRLDMGDLDQKFSRYDSSQNFNLVDVGAVFFAGPAGLAVTKGYDFARIFQGTGGSTSVRTLVSEWRVDHGIAQATDVAMATPHNRVALKGSLNFVTGRFDDVTVALIDAKGCPQVRQKVRGPFLNPQVDPPNVLSGLTGPTRRLLGKVKDLFGGKCEVFYAGSVPPPT